MHGVDLQLEHLSSSSNNTSYSVSVSGSGGTFIVQNTSRVVDTVGTMDLNVRHVYSCLKNKKNFRFQILVRINESVTLIAGAVPVVAMSDKWKVSGEVEEACMYSMAQYPCSCRIQMEYTLSSRMMVG